jgi:hypothetical protein
MYPNSILSALSNKVVIRPREYISRYNILVALVIFENGLVIQVKHGSLDTKGYLA